MIIIIKYIKLNSGIISIAIILMLLNTIYYLIIDGFNNNIFVFQIIPIVLIILSTIILVKKSRIKKEEKPNDVDPLSETSNPNDKYIPVTFGTPLTSALMYVKDHDKLYDFFIKIAYGHLKLDRQSYQKAHAIPLFHNTLYERVEKALLEERDYFIMRTTSNKAIVYTIRINFTINDTNAIPIININPVFINHNIIPFKEKSDK